jgi:hypothetical protein
VDAQVLPRPARAICNEHGVIVDWLLRTALVLAVIGVVIFDAASMAINLIGLDSAAHDVAAALSADLVDSGPLTPAALRERAKPLVKESGARLASISIDSDGVLHLRLKRKAGTLVVGHIDALGEWVKATADARASTDPT